MKRLKITLALVLTMMLPGFAHALTLRTAPFNGQDVISGFARCGVTNGSVRESDRAVITLLSSAGTVLATDGPFLLDPGATAFGTPGFLTSTTPTWCRCEVPNRQHMCSFIYVNGTIVEVIRAE